MSSVLFFILVTICMIIYVFSLIFLCLCYAEKDVDVSAVSIICLIVPILNTIIFLMVRKPRLGSLSKLISDLKS